MTERIYSRKLSARGPVVLVHGGAGARDGEDFACEIEGCRAAARAGAAVLASGGTALDAVEGAVVVLEDDPEFNAGRGATLTEEGTVELDAAIMSGRDLRAGGVACLRGYGNPIRVARAVLEEGRHVLYAADGAAAFAAGRGFTRVDPEALITPKSRERLARVLERREAKGGNTVGAVALDAAGNVAAATSTGGTTGKRVGRIGDSPIFGAGTYADEVGAISATGHGEGILRVALGSRILEALRAGADLETALREGLALMLRRVRSRGGVIAVHEDGGLALARSDSTMPWSAFGLDGEIDSGS